MKRQLIAVSLMSLVVCGQIVARENVKVYSRKSITKTTRNGIETKVVTDEHGNTTTTVKEKNVSPDVVAKALASAGSSSVSRDNGSSCPGMTYINGKLVSWTECTDDSCVDVIDLIRQQGTELTASFSPRITYTNGKMVSCIVDTENGAIDIAAAINQQALDNAGEQLAQRLLRSPLHVGVAALANLMRRGATIPCDQILKLPAIKNFNALDVDVIMNRYNECIESAQFKR